MSQSILHQLIIGANRRDAITQTAFLWQRWLHEAGYTSEIYAPSIHDNCKDVVRPWHSFQGKGGILYHHSLGSPVVDDLLARGNFIPVYHNVTPAEWFAGSDPELARLTTLGLRQLEQMAAAVPVAVGVSAFNCEQMRAAGFKSADLVPLTFEQTRYESIQLVPLEVQGGPILLFVGRMVPNKRQEDLVRLLYACQQIEPATQLVLVGSDWMPSYTDWVRYVAEQLGVQDSVHMLGSVSFGQMAGAYESADFFVSMSEHEGFGMPLIESMHFGLPVVAYRSSAIPDTLGGVGVTFGRKDYAAVAELILQIWRDSAWQQRIIAAQKKRLQDFLEPQVKARFSDHFFSDE